MKPGISTRMKAMLIILTLFLLILVPFTITTVSAAVRELNVTPQIVDPGARVSITGKASPNEEVWLSSSFELSLPVSGGEYFGEFNGIHFPRGEKEFSVTAENVKNVRASLYPVFWQTIEYPLEGPKNATNGIATLSVSFPATWHGITIDIYGTKQVKIYGDAADTAPSVNLDITMLIKVLADSNGNFELDINTEGVPEGEFLISAGGKKETVYIGVTPTPSPTPSPSSSPTSTPLTTGGAGSGGGGGGSGSIVPETTPTPTLAIPENVTSNEPATPSPPLIPSPTPASTTAPQTTPPTTPIKTDTGEKTPGPTPQNKTNQSPQGTTKPSPIPGFELIGCLAALLIIIWLRRVKRKK